MKRCLEEVQMYFFLFQGNEDQMNVYDVKKKKSKNEKSIIRRTSRQRRVANERRDM